MTFDLALKGQIKVLWFHWVCIIDNVLLTAELSGREASCCYLSYLQYRSFIKDKRKMISRSKTVNIIFIIERLLVCTEDKYGNRFHVVVDEPLV